MEKQKLNWDELGRESRRVLASLEERVMESLGETPERDSKESGGNPISEEYIALQKRFNATPPFTKFRKRVIRKRIATSVAAAAILLLLVMGGALMVDTFSGRNTENLTASDYTSIKPVTKKARLTLADGQEVDLSSLRDTLLEQDGRILDITFGEIDYSGKAARDRRAAQTGVRGQTGKPSQTVEKPGQIAQLRYNTIEIPRGAEYSLTLEDGTIVWLNADSKLRYPVNFTSNERRVFLEGEAYFEVAHNQEKPFVVSTNSGDVTVLGTSFNVKNYAEEAAIYTTLVEGSVSFTVGTAGAATAGATARTADAAAAGATARTAGAAAAGTTAKSAAGTPTLIAPGQQLSYYPELGEQELKEVNVYEVISWRERYFRFTDMPLDQIISSLARWYDFTVSYKSEEIKQMRFSGNLDRYDTIEPFISVLESGAEITFTMEQNHLVVSRR